MHTKVSEHTLSTFTVSLNKLLCYTCPMSEQTSQGVITHSISSRRTDYLYRISIKCLIRNDKGEVLVVKETDRDWWDLPGGGMDHHENIKSAIARELKEEVGLEGDFTCDVIAVEELQGSQLIIKPSEEGGSYHESCAIRMAENAVDGCVDVHGKIFGEDGVVLGSSIFPCIGVANPALTMMALSARTGMFVAENY